MFPALFLLSSTESFWFLRFFVVVVSFQQKFGISDCWQYQKYVKRDFSSHSERAISLCNSIRKLLPIQGDTLSSTSKPQMWVSCCMCPTKALHPMEGEVTGGAWLPGPLPNYQRLVGWPGVWTEMLRIGYTPSQLPCCYMLFVEKPGNWGDPRSSCFNPFMWL